MTHKKIQNGHQFKGHVIWIVRIEARRAAQSIVDILGGPICWCDVGHCVAVFGELCATRICVHEECCVQKKINVIELSK